MKGQWIGNYTGDSSGRIMINIDEHVDHYQVEAYMVPHNSKIPSSFARSKTINKDKSQTVKADIYAIDPRNGEQCEWEEIRPLYDNDVIHSKRAKVRLNLISEKTLNIQATTDIGISLKSQLIKPEETKDSRIPGVSMTWEEFKEYVSKNLSQGFLYRGQKIPWKLRTSFHRGERYCIGKFIQNDIPQLHGKLSSITSHYFDLGIPDQKGAFVSLLQHHGYPTPLLDWTYSPYVAAFFAFRGWTPEECNQNKANETIRIYIFNNKDWCKHYGQIQNANPPLPHLSVINFIAINNPRLIPQQSVTTLTNIDDIELYILNKEIESNSQYLQAIDIPISEREKAMDELRFMGISAGSMFPGIDGICEEMMERNF